jgi:hypothetical protein
LSGRKSVKVKLCNTLSYKEELMHYFAQYVIQTVSVKLHFKAAAEKIQVAEILNYYVDKLEKMRRAGQPLFDARAEFDD